MARSATTTIVRSEKMSSEQLQAVLGRRSSSASSRHRMKNRPTRNEAKSALRRGCW